MQWYDAVFTIGGMALLALLVPTARSDDAAIPRSTSIPTALVLGLYAVTFALMDAPTSAVVNSISATLWLFIVGC